MNPLEKLRDELLKKSHEECSAVKNQNLVPNELYIYYAFYEHDQLRSKLMKLINDRLKDGVSWDQISALNARVTGGQGRYERSQKKVERLQKTFEEAPDDKSIQAKLKSAKEKLVKADEELKLMDDLSAKVAAYKKSQQGGNHG